METEFLLDDKVAVIHMRRGENRINIDSLTELNKALDEVERNPTVELLITTGDGKFYSNGLDFMLLQNSDRTVQMAQLLKDTYRRILTFPMVTIAAINGHAFAGGAMLTFSHDLRVMRSGQGWLSINEIDLGARIPPALIQLVRCKIPSGPVEHAVFVFGKRFTAEMALEHGLVHKVSPPQNLLQDSIKLGYELCDNRTFDRAVLRQMKTDVYKKAVDLLNLPVKDAMTYQDNIGMIVKSNM